MPDDNMIFGIEFQTNAKQVAKDIKDLEKVTDDLEKSGQKRTISDVDKLNNAKKQIQINKKEAEEKNKSQEKERKTQEKFDKEKSKENKKQDKQFKSELKSQKELERIEKKRLAMAKKFIIGSIAAGSVLKFALDTIQSGRQLDIASKSSLSDPQTVEALSFITKKFGGNLSTATNTLMTLNDRLYNFSKFGLTDNSMQEILTKFPQTFDKIFKDNLGNIITDPLKVLQNISKVMETMSDETSRQFANALGLDNSMYLILRESNGNFISLLEEAKRNSFANEETIKKLQNTANLIDETKRSFQVGFSTSLSTVLGEDIKDISDTTKGIAELLGTTIGAIAKIIGYAYKLGEEIANKLGLSDIMTYAMINDSEREIFNNEKEKKSYDEYIKNGRKKPIMPSPINNPIYQEQMLEYQIQLSEWQKNEDIFNKKHKPLSKENKDILNKLIVYDINKNFDYLNGFNELTNTPLNFTTPQNLINNSIKNGDVKNITVNNGDITINGVDTNNAEQVGKTVQTINEDTAYLYLREMSSPYSK